MKGKGYLTVDLSGVICVWDHEPVYVEYDGSVKHQRWMKTNKQIMAGVRSIYDFPLFDQFVAEEKIQPGPMGIEEIEFEVRKIIR